MYNIINIAVYNKYFKCKHISYRYTHITAERLVHVTIHATRSVLLKVVVGNVPVTDKTVRSI